MEETGVPRENHRSAASHLQTLSHNVHKIKWEKVDLIFLKWPYLVLTYVLNIFFVKKISMGKKTQIVLTLYVSFSLWFLGAKMDTTLQQKMTIICF